MLHSVRVSVMHGFITGVYACLKTATSSCPYLRSPFSAPGVQYPSSRLSFLIPWKIFSSWKKTFIHSEKLVALQQVSSQPTPLPASTNAWASSQPSASFKYPPANQEAHQHQPSPTKYATSPNGSHDRKQNVAIRGILECPKNTCHHNRILQDDQLAAKVISSIIPTFSSVGIKECTCTCLGRYVASNPWPRSLLIQLLRACDVSQDFS